MDAVRYDGVGNVAVLTVEYVLYRRGRVPDGAGRHPRADRPGGRGVRHAHRPDCDARHERARRRHDGARDAQGDPAGGRAVFLNPGATRRARAAGHEIRTGLLSLRGTAEVPRSRDNADHRGRRTRTRHRAADEEIEFHLFAPLVNEGAKELEDGTAIGAGDIDVAWVNGYGFPAHKGGPMFWGEGIGLDRIHEAALEAAKRNGPRWGPGSCSSGSHVKVGAGRMPDGRSLFTFLNRLSRR